MSSTNHNILIKKLAIRAGHKVFLINVPVAGAKLLGSFPTGAKIITKQELPADRVVVFVSSKTELDRLLPSGIAATKPDGALWVAYPKKESGLSDVSREIVMNKLRLASWKAVAQIAVDDVWTAIRARVEKVS